MLGLKSLVLPLCALLVSGGCNPKHDPTGPRPAETLTATEIAGIRLTYMCGNTFRVRNPNDQEAPVTWDVYNTGETGSLTLPPKPAGAAHSETFFTTVNKGTVRLFYNGQLIQTKANGNKPPCQSTTRPAIPDSPSVPDDSAFTTVSPTDPDFVYYRRLYDVVFLDNATDAQVLAFFAKYQASIVGGAPLVDIYTVQVPDPGANFQAVDSLVNAMNGEPGVEAAASIARTSPKGPLHGRYPNDGAGYGRDSWFGSSVSTWALRAIRAPLAWGCETGTYSTDKVKVAVLEQAFIPDPDLPASLLTRLIAPDGRGGAMDQNTVKHFEEHGRGVAGLVGAQGDNNLGAAGVMWRADMVVYELTGANRRIDNDVLTFQRHFVPDLIRRQPRVLSISSEIHLEPGQTGNQKVLTATIDRLLRRVPGLLIIKASGDSSRTLSIEDAKSAWTANAIRAALLRARDNGHANRILFVAGTQPGEAYWPGSDWISTATEIAAPAKQVGLLPGQPGQFAFGEGTSFAAPLVAGVAAQLIALDPALTSAQVKDYIVRGAQSSRVDPTSGVLTPVDPVAGAPETVYQLDAYGALSLLSRERQGTPICGFPVTLELPQGGPRVRLARNGSNSETIPVIAASGYQVDGLSVAQGGRLLAVGQSDVGQNTPRTPMEVNEYALANGQWSVRRTIPGVGVRTYLERDTVDSDNISGFFGTQWTLRGPRWGSGTVLNLAETTQPYLTPTNTPFYPFKYPYTHGVEFSSDGAFAVVRTRLESPPCPNYQDQMWLVTLPNGPVQALLPTQCDNEGPRDAAWDPNGSRFILADIGANGVTYRPYRIVSGASQADGAGVTIPNRFPTDYSLGAGAHTADPTGTTATWLELVPNGCYLTTRTTTTFALVSEQLYPYSNPDWLGFCQVPVQMLRTKLRSVTLRH